MYTLYSIYLSTAFNSHMDFSTHGEGEKDMFFGSSIEAGLAAVDEETIGTRRLAIRNIDEDSAVPIFGSSPMISSNRKPIAAEEEIMELMWQDGRLLVQSHPSPKNRPASAYQGDPGIPMFQLPAGGMEGQALNYGRHRMQEDEMAEWLHYFEPFHEADLWRAEDGGRPESGSGMRDSMVVDSAPAASARGWSYAGYSHGSRSAGVVMSETVAPVAEPEPPARRPRTAEDSRRTGGSEPEEDGCDSEDTKSESRTRSAKKQRCGPPTSTRRSRFAEVHNRSERRRRDRINEKIRTLQELIPCSTKADKASTLDEAIMYLKTLQLQVQMMSTGCTLVPMVLPCMSMGMSMTDPMLMFPNNMVPSAPFPAASSSATFPPVPSQLMTHLRPPGLAPIDHHLNLMLNQHGTQNPMPQPPVLPNIAYPF